MNLSQGRFESLSEITSDGTHEGSRKVACLSSLSMGVGDNKPAWGHLGMTAGDRVHKFLGGSQEEIAGWEGEDLCMGARGLTR